MQHESRILGVRMFDCVPNIGWNVRLYSKHYMLQTLYTCNVWPSIGRNVRLQTLDALLREVMFGSAINIRCIVAGSDGCGGSAANIPFAIIIISPTKTTTLPHNCTICTFCTFCTFYVFLQTWKCKPFGCVFPSASGAHCIAKLWITIQMCTLY